MTEKSYGANLASDSALFYLFISDLKRKAGNSLEDGESPQLAVKGKGSISKRSMPRLAMQRFMQVLIGASCV